MVAFVANLILYTCMHRSTQAYYIQYMYIRMWTHINTMLLIVARLDLCSGSSSLTAVSGLPVQVQAVRQEESP